MADLSLAFDILARDRNASRTFKEVGDSAESAGKKGSGFGTMIKGAMGIAAGAIAAAGIGDFFKDSIAEARESQKVGALTAQVIKSTGAAAKISAAQVGDLATAISNKTGIDDEAIQSGANLLLTFKNIRNEAGKGNDIFNQTTSIMTDMATAMGQEPKAAAIQLGKALNDPIKGISALSRVGVTFSDSQKKAIKTMVESGDTMGAQKIILKELQSEFGGAAAASSTMGEKAGVAFGNLKEQIGTALLPIIDKFAGFLTDKAIPAVSQFITEMQNGTGTGGQVVAVVKDIGSAVQATASFLNEHRSIVAAVAAGYLAWKVATLGIAAAQGISLALLMAQTPGTAAYAIVQGAAAAASGVWSAAQWGLNAAMSANPIALVVIAIAALVAGIVIAYKNSETFRNIVKGAFEAVGKAGTWLWDNALRPAFKLIADTWLTVVGVLVHGAAKAFGWIPGIGPKLKKAAAEFDKLRARVDASLDGIGDEAEKYGTDWAKGLAAGIRKNAHVPVGVAQGVANKIAAATRRAMDAHSPSRVAASLGEYWSQGLAVGVDSGRTDVVRAATRVATGLPRATVAALPPASGGSHPLASGGVVEVRLPQHQLDYLADRMAGRMGGALVGAGSRQQNAARNGVAR